MWLAGKQQVLRDAQDDKFLVGGLFDLVDYLEDGVYGGVGDDAVAEVEDVAGLVVVEGEDFSYAGFEDLGWGEEGDGVEVALHCDAVAEGAAGFVEGYAPVETEDVSSGFAEGG